MAVKERKFHCVMSTDDFRKLSWLAEYTGLSRSTIVRQSILARYRVSHDHSNLCADGHQCLCSDLRQFPMSPLGEDQLDVISGDEDASVRDDL